MIKTKKKSFSWIALLIFIIIALFIGFTLMMIFSTDFAIKATALQSGVHLDAGRQQRLIVVNASGSAATITCLEAKEGRYSVASGMQNIKAIAGKNGIGKKAEWTDGLTPYGLFPVVSALGSGQEANTELEYRQIGESTVLLTENEGAGLISDESPDGAIALYGRQEYELAALIGTGSDSAPILLICLSDTLKAEEAAAQTSAKSGESIAAVGTNGSIALEKADLERILGWAERDKTYILIMK